MALFENKAVMGKLKKPFKKINQLLVLLGEVENFSQSRVEMLCRRNVEDEVLSCSAKLSFKEVLQRMKAEVRRSIHIDIDSEMKVIRQRYSVPNGVGVSISLKEMRLCGVFTASVGSCHYEHEDLSKVIQWKHKMQSKIENSAKSVFPIISYVNHFKEWVRETTLEKIKKHIYYLANFNPIAGKHKPIIQ